MAAIILKLLIIANWSASVRYWCRKSVRFM